MDRGASGPIELERVAGGKSLRAIPQSALIESPGLAAQTLDPTPPRLALQTLKLRGIGRFGRAARLGSYRSLADQLHQPFARVLTVHLLRPEPLREQHQHPLL